MKKGVKKIIGGGIIFTAGLALPFVILIPLFFQGDAITFRVPGSIELTIEEPGQYYLWHNYNTVFEGQSYSFSKELPHGLSFALVEKNSGLSVPIQSDLSLSTESGSQKNTSIGYYELTHPGQYTLSVTGNTDDRVFSFKKSIFENGLLFFGGAILGMILAFVAGIGALVLIIFGIIDLVRESKSAKPGVQPPRPPRA